MIGKSTVVITGPTTTGKTDVAIALARRTNGELVNGWATPLYSGFPLSTCAVDLAEASDIPRHLYGVLEPNVEPFSPEQYAAEVRRITKDILERGGTPIIDGGNVDYLRALLYQDKNGTGSYSPIIGIRWHDKTRVKARIRKRVEALMGAGLLDEVYMALGKGYYNSSMMNGNCLCRPLIKYVEGNIPTMEEAIDEIVEGGHDLATSAFEELLSFDKIRWIRHDPADVDRTVGQILKLMDGKN